MRGPPDRSSSRSHITIIVAAASHSATISPQLPRFLDSHEGTQPVWTVSVRCPIDGGGIHGNAPRDILRSGDHKWLAARQPDRANLTLWAGCLNRPVDGV